MNSGVEANLLFGLMAIQNGLIDQEQIVAAYEDWNLDKSRSLADHIVARGELESSDRAVLEALVERHLKRHGGDAEQSVAALIVGRANLEELMQYEEFSVGSTISYFASEPGNRRDANRDGGSQHSVRPGATPGQRFQVLRPYAKGGLGSVSVAIDTEVHREVALKQILDKHADDPISRGRFLLEAEITGGLEHPGIVPVYGLGADTRGRLYYAMRFIRGDTLKETADRFHRDGSLRRDAGRRSLELRKLLRHFIDVCNAVDYAHGRGVLHRDIKPGNVILGRHGETLLVDWGMAKAIGRSEPGDSEGTLTPSDSSGSTETLPGKAMGTPGFMSAEQAAGDLERLGPQSDVYSLGATFYYILTGRPPLTGHVAEILRKTREGNFPPPRQIGPSIPKPLEAACLKAMGLKPEDRYPTARALADDVERWQADEPVSAWREPSSVRMRRWARKHRVAVAVAAGLLVATTIALGLSTVFITRERNEAEAQGLQARKAIELLTGAADLAFDERLDPFQEDFLVLALDYFQRFTDRVATDPKVRLEHGRAYQQMGVIEQKLGHGAKSDESYRKALELLEPLATARGLGLGARQSLARTQFLLANLLVSLSQGDPHKKAEVLYRRALETQRALVSDPSASTVDRLWLGQTLKSQADLLRSNGKLKPAKLDYDEAIAVLETAPSSDEKNGEFRTALALAIDSRGWIHSEQGELELAEKDYRRALEMLAGLVDKFPTIPRHREGLARACNSLGLIEEKTARLPDAEGHFRRELPLVERLSQDFPDRPDYQRFLARTLMNLEKVLSEQNRATDAEPHIRRAIKVNSTIALNNPDDVQIQFDLAKQHNNLGMLLHEKGEEKQAIDSFLSAKAISEELLGAFPDQPRYGEQLAGVLTNLAAAMTNVGDAKVKEVYQKALPIYEKLVADFPDNINYKIGQARCLQNYGPLVAGDNRPEVAESLYRKALSLLETNAGHIPSAEHLGVQAEVLNNLGDLQKASKSPLAEATLSRAIEIFKLLVERKSAALRDRQSLAIARNNLGELLVKLNRLDDAGKLFEQSVADFESLVADSPRSTDIQNQLGMILAHVGDLLDRLGKPAPARGFLERAVTHGRQAVVLGKNRQDTRSELASHLIQLATIELKLGAYSDAAASALEIPRASPASEHSEGCLTAARILARVSAQSSSDATLTRNQRDELGDEYLPRAIVLLREAIDAKPELGERIKNEKEFNEIRSRPEFTTMLNSLVDVKRTK
jgi:serine/threonine protein kinase